MGRSDALPRADPREAAAGERLERGRALRRENRLDEAIEEFRAAAALLPDSAEAHHALGNALKGARRNREAAASLRRAAELEPRNGAIWLNLGVACLELRLAAESIDCFREAIRLEPGRPEAHNILGHALLVLGRCSEAGRALEEALRLRPGYAAAFDNLGRVLKAQGRSEEAVARHRAALAAQPRPETHSNLLYSLNFPPGIPDREIFREHERWAELYAAPRRSAERPTPAGSAGRERLRVGYVSPDLTNHAVAYFIEPVLAAHDRSGFEIFCYSDAAEPDGVTRRLRALAERWRDVAGLGHERLAEIVREDRIDILVDLAGHTAGNRLLAFAERPAPVQVTWLGYPNTTGLKQIDFRLTDAVADPPGETESLHSEELFRLPENFSCYRPPADSPAVSPAPAAFGSGVTFGCFNNFAKANRQMILLWAEILRVTPGSRLLLRSRGFADRETAAAVRSQFASAGIVGERVELDGQERSTLEHLRLYRRVDIALDPFPYNGATTTCEALWMGVPVVTLAGGAHRSRVGASLLTRLGAGEWVANSPAQYASIAAALAGAPAELNDIRAGLRERMLRSPLCDGPRFTRNLEYAYLEMWRKKRSGRGP